MAGGTCFAQTGRVGGVTIGNFALDCANLANTGISLDRLQYSTIKPISIYNQLVDGLIFQPNPTAANDNLMGNVFERLVIRGKNRCIYFSDAVGGAHTSNICHNKFLYIFADCRGAAVNNCIVLGDSDNNNFGFIYTAVFNYPTDYGLVLNSYSRSNYFFHFQGTVHALSGSTNAIYAFDRENSQPQPTVDSGANLFWTETGNNATDWNMTVPLKNLQAYIVGNLSQPGLAPDPSRFSLVRTATNTITGLGYSSGGELQLYHTPDGSNVGMPIRINYNSIGFLGSAPVPRPTVTGSKGANAALTSLVSALTALGLVTDSTT